MKLVIEGLGNELRAGRLEEMRAHVAKEAARWAQVIRDAKIAQQQQQ